MLVRKIPVTLNGSEHIIVGYLELNDTLSDEMLRDTYVSWLWIPQKRRIESVVLSPMQSLQKE